MKFIFSIFFFLILVSSCSRDEKNNKTTIGYAGSDSLRKSIDLKEKSLKKYYDGMINGDLHLDTLPHQLINTLLKEYQIFYKSYPKDSLTPYYLDKIHQLFTQEKQYTYAVDWVDTLMNNYPNYRNKTMVLYSAATSSDIYLMDTNRVKRYYNRMLSECPKLKLSVKKQISHRLKYIALPYLEYINKQRYLK